MKQFALILLMSAACYSCSKESTKTTETSNNTAPRAALTDRTISFSGITWTVRSESGTSGPGPNYWSNSSSSVWVDENGWLHLKLRKDASTGHWLCAEVYSNSTFGYGTYSWQVEGRVDLLDKNLVFGLFNYKAGADGFHEVDIEFSRWGNSSYPNYNYTVYPSTTHTPASVSATNELSLSGTYTTHTFTRTSSAVSFKGYHGFTNAAANAFFPWTTPSGFPVSSLSLPIHMNLWLVDGAAPSNGQSVELIVHNFTFTPQ
ncbi:hypothetical protein GA0116948_104323 [Chitinophaga costaii]|uniref:Glycosyl hydrolases family 16 n=1 Tax=Chitinophaga costaii TaxID=1335309 RepID=A0A1C4CVT4_9BACT|nr:hypothetical protein [Chitinophaga costaii]PUZ26926.1 hypothetical protein DCM91_06705 [Chitinophaga costaii]SCC23138.1 hypothetical protein GA0116948_104323 [Chitinophaga costaii]